MDGSARRNVTRDPQEDYYYECYEEPPFLSVYLTFEVA